MAPCKSNILILFANSVCQPFVNVLLKIPNPAAAAVVLFVGLHQRQKSKGNGRSANDPRMAVFSKINRVQRAELNSTIEIDILATRTR